MPHHRRLPPLTALVARYRPALLGGAIGGATALVLGVLAVVWVTASPAGVHFVPQQVVAALGDSGSAGPGVSFDMAGATTRPTPGASTAAADVAAAAPQASGPVAAPTPAGHSARPAPTGAPRAAVTATPAATSAPASSAAPLAPATPRPTAASAPPQAAVTPTAVPSAQPTSSAGKGHRDDDACVLGVFCG